MSLWRPLRVPAVPEHAPRSLPIRILSKYIPFAWFHCTPRAPRAPMRAPDNPGSAQAMPHWFPCTHFRTEIRCGMSRSVIFSKQVRQTEIGEKKMVKIVAGSLAEYFINKYKIEFEEQRLLFPEHQNF